jgi:hypothetical protein
VNAAEEEQQLIKALAERMGGIKRLCGISSTASW